MQKITEEELVKGRLKKPIKVSTTVRLIALQNAVALESDEGLIAFTPEVARQLGGQLADFAILAEGLSPKDDRPETAPKKKIIMPGLLWRDTLKM